MTREMRLVLFEKELGRLLTSEREHDSVTFSDIRVEDHYVHYMRHDGAIYGEVGSLRQTPADRKPRERVESALGCLGFGGAEAGRSYSRDHLPQDARRLACLTELLFGAAFGGAEDLSVVVMTRASREAAPPPRQLELAVPGEIS